MGSEKVCLRAAVLERKGLLLSLSRKYVQSVPPRALFTVLCSRGSEVVTDGPHNGVIDP
jgi:hypothetical protein